MTILIHTKPHGTNKSIPDHTVTNLTLQTIQICVTMLDNMEPCQYGTSQDHRHPKGARDHTEP